MGRGVVYRDGAVRETARPASIDGAARLAGTHGGVLLMRFHAVRGLVAGLVLALGVGSAASALTLHDLVVLGQSFDSGNGTLTFSGFQATLTPTLDQDLTHYNVAVTATGFQLTGAFGAADGELGDMFLRYTVAGKTDAINGASLFFNGQTLPAIPGLGASIAEDYFSAPLQLPTLGSLFVARTGGGLDVNSASLVFAVPQQSIYVEKDILVDARALNVDQQPILGTVAAISVIRQDFTVVPEPGTILMLGAGLAGLALSGRKRI